MNSDTHSSQWPQAVGALRALSADQRGIFLSGLSLEDYARRSGRLPTAHRVKFDAAHPLLDAPHAMSLALQLLRDDGQLDAVSHLALNKDPSDKRSWTYRHQATVTTLAPLAGLTSLKMLMAGLSAVSDIDALQGCTGLTHLYFLNPQARTPAAPALLDLSPLSGLSSLEMLQLDRAVRPTDLRPLSGLAALRILIIADAACIRDLRPLSGLTTLQRVELTNALRLSNLRPLASILGALSSPQNRCIESRVANHALAAMIEAWHHDLTAPQADQLAALRVAMRSGDVAALAAALPGTPPAVLELLLATLTVSDSGHVQHASWADLARVPPRHQVEVAMRLADTQGSLARWSALNVPADVSLDHALTDRAAGLTHLTLASGEVLTGETLAEWRRLPAALRTGLQNVAHDGVHAGLAAMAEHTLSPALRTLLLSRLPHFVVAKAPYTLTGLDLRHLSLSGKTITAQLSGADLRGMDLTGAHFSGADLRGARLDNATLDQVQFSTCQLDGVHLEGATWEGAIIDSTSRWPEGSTGPTMLPLSELAAAHSALEESAYALSRALSSMDKPLTPRIQSMLNALPTMGMHYNSAGQLQRTLDSLRLADIKRSLPVLFGHADELEITGQYDDETGHDLYQITLGAVSFNSAGNFIYQEAALLEIFEALSSDEDRVTFHRFLHGELNVEHDEWEDTPAAVLFDEPETLDADAMRAALSHAATVFEYLSEEECLGTEPLLEEFFSIIERIYRRCSPMQKESESLPMRWIEARLW
ncbi:MAG: pentapeptide repeat-containing protein [Myxococcota bacterium]|nr:pentapeptide repeat-containing protein [Myxococcota bacterium]